MQVTLTIPDEVAESYLAGKDPTRVALEAIAIDAYRTQKLTESQIRRMLGYGTRMQVHALLKAHGVPLHYSPEHLALDIQASEQPLAQRASGARCKCGTALPSMKQ
ncbi:Uncharacterised protein family (UPF0175) [Bryocella elongata]|uniref:Uncharacterized protein family (UPF0175) n=1 Tax=Bryocella elongata TaxID=863522 RepID=A0A1H6BXY2_9BACT|nr:UPF0175 family protein [Bryocella elongata]SEG65295.1 Uncharacterised protein family (UPF0175) [Bryocella elongata]